MRKDYTSDEMRAKFELSNENKSDYDEPKWTLDCQRKFDFDGSVLRVSSRFYPPSYNTKGEGWGGGSVDFLYGDDIVIKTKYFKPRDTIDELMEDVEEYVKVITDKILIAVKETLRDD